MSYPQTTSVLSSRKKKDTENETHRRLFTSKYGCNLGPLVKRQGLPHSFHSPYLPSEALGHTIPSSAFSQELCIHAWYFCFYHSFLNELCLGVEDKLAPHCVQSHTLSPFSHPLFCLQSLRSGLPSSHSSFSLSISQISADWCHIDCSLFIIYFFWVSILMLISWFYFYTFLPPSLFLLSFPTPPSLFFSKHPLADH